MCVRASDIRYLVQAPLPPPRVSRRNVCLDLFPDLALDFILAFFFSDEVPWGACHSLIKYHMISNYRCWTIACNICVRVVSRSQMRAEVCFPISGSRFYISVFWQGDAVKYGNRDGHKELLLEQFSDNYEQ